jgi:hypothetical protein
MVRSQNKKGGRKGISDLSKRINETKVEEVDIPGAAHFSFDTFTFKDFYFIVINNSNNNPVFNEEMYRRGFNRPVLNRKYPLDAIYMPLSQHPREFFEMISEGADFNTIIDIEDVTGVWGRDRKPINIITYKVLFDDLLLFYLDPKIKERLDVMRSTPEFMEKFAIRVNMHELAGNYFDGELPYTHIGSIKDGSERDEIINKLYKKWFEEYGQNVGKLMSMPSYQKTIKDIASKYDSKHSAALEEVLTTKIPQYGGKRKRKTNRRKSIKRKQRKTKRKGRR